MKIEELEGQALKLDPKSRARLAGRLLAAAKMDESLEKDAVRELSLEYDTRELSRDYEKASDANRAKINQINNPRPTRPRRSRTHLLMPGFTAVPQPGRAAGPPCQMPPPVSPDGR